MSRLHSHLKVVGGTGFSGTSQKILSTSVHVEDTIPVKICSPKPTETMDSMREQARRLICELAVEGAKTIGDLFDEMNDNLLNYAQESIDSPHTDRILKRHCEIRDKFYAVGILTVSAEPEQDLSVEVFGQVYDPRKALRCIPQLKKYESVLPGLTL